MKVCDLGDKLRWAFHRKTLGPMERKTLGPMERKTLGPMELRAKQVSNSEAGCNTSAPCSKR
jgi:hypothetical protein